jgi:hypothetical protein
MPSTAICLRIVNYKQAAYQVETGTKIIPGVYFFHVFPSKSKKNIKLLIYPQEYNKIRFGTQCGD